MSYRTHHVKHKEGDKCPACWSTDSKLFKGFLVKQSANSWGLKCTDCKYTCLSKKAIKHKTKVFKSKQKRNFNRDLQIWAKMKKEQSQMHRFFEAKISKD